jgi:hypothetical protein
MTASVKYSKAPEAKFQISFLLVLSQARRIHFPQTKSMLGEEGFVDAEKQPAAAQNEKITKDDGGEKKASHRSLKQLPISRIIRKVIDAGRGLATSRQQQRRLGEGHDGRGEERVCARQSNDAQGPRKPCQSVIINLLLILGRALLWRLGTWGSQTCRAFGV